MRAGAEVLVRDSPKRECTDIDVRIAVRPFPSEGQVQRQLHKAIAPDRLLNHSKVFGIRRRSCQWCCVETGERVEAAIQLEISIRRIKTRLVEDVERVGLELKIEALCDLEILENREIETRLKRGAKDVTSIGAEAGFESIANGLPGSRRTARRHSILAWAKKRD